jgi:hypothetical protein
MNQSRFAILSEEFNQHESNKNNLQKSNKPKEEKIILNKIGDVSNKNNTFKQNYNERRLSNNEYIRVKDNESKMKKEQERKKMEEDKKQSLSKENFPELSNEPVVKYKYTEPSASSFIHKLNEIVQTELVENETENDWVTIKYDETMCKIVIIFDEVNKDVSEKSSDTEDILCNHNTMISLADLHKRRTEEYIELWGKEDWEKYFLFSNDEYNYLDEDEEEYEFNDSDLYFENDYFIDDLEL